MEFKTYLEIEVVRKLNEKIAALHNYADNISGVDSWYLVDDIMEILGIKSIWHKIGYLIEDQEKINRTISVGGVSRYRALITKKAVCKIIASMRRKPHDIICQFFGYQVDTPALVVQEEHNFDAGPNNIYIKRLQHIFASQKIELFYKVDIGQSIVILDVFFPTHGIVVLFNKKSNIFAAENISPYVAARTEILKKFIRLKDLRVIQFTAYDSKSVAQFDELLKVLFESFLI